MQSSKSAPADNAMILRHGFVCHVVANWSGNGSLKFLDWSWKNGCTASGRNFEGLCEVGTKNPSFNACFNKLLDLFLDSFFDVIRSLRKFHGLAFHPPELNQIF